MFSPQRRETIVQLLQEKKQIVVKELAKQLNVSEGTLRTDLKILEEEGALERTHGGAILPRTHVADHRASSRSDLNREEKKRIGQAAAALVRPGQCVILDASSTALELSRHLVDYDYLTVVTNGIEAALELNRNPRINVIMIGGVLRPSSRTIEGLLGKSILSDIHADLFFTSAEGFSLEAGMTDFSVYESELKKLMAENAGRVVAMLDYTKLNRRSIATSVKAAQVHTLITDAKADAAFLRRLSGIEVIVAK
ncbi:DeoR/GlpR family DNA-binding transcription regulator [Paenibacillus cymbidii]|uniref:DeoR/GlpR family DNA-binding transcription regulator n=1 Tax=Paenibacillus cymbidii TaxID=1639034 RepID=UPI00108220A0|nr:DeoR/GlpR family DNA-binding transcription regulator [Paenibacillus cymbidii]